jgi:signal transduction histidine kinase
VAGVLSLYRFPNQINDTVRQGLSLLWIVAGLGGLILYFALYGLFRSVYSSQRRAESQFAKLSSEHEHIIQIEKLSGMGQMVSEIAHQLNNPLVGVINLTELAERDVGNTQRVKELLGEVRKAGNHCRDFVQRMLQIGKVARCEPQPTDMNQLMRETIAFCEQSLGRNSALLLQLPSESVMLEIDPTLIRNALFNLIHNAAQADSNGPIVVSLAPKQRDGAIGYEMAVSDRGPGFTPETLSKLFTPFFTTRSGGTGLGLSIAQHIAMMHGGKIVAENKPEGGARFAIWLPTEKRTYETANSAG